MKAADAFEVWLQGRINLCVQGLVSRIARLEAENAELREKLEQPASIGTVETFDQLFITKFDDAIENWMDKATLLNYMTGKDIFDEIEEHIEEMLDDRDEGSSRGDFDSRVKEVVANMSFETSASRY